MRKQLTSTVCFGLLILLQLFSIEAAHAAEFNIIDSHRLVQFKGVLNQESVTALISKIKAGQKTLLIESEGGDAASGQLLGQYIASNEVTVIISRYCLSACANYVFLAASKKLLLPDAVLGFHGGLVRPNKESGASETSSISAPMQVLYEAEEKFLKAIKVDQALISRSFNLTRPSESKVVFNIQTDDKQYSEISESEAAGIIAEAQSQKKFLSVDIILMNASRDKAYFPSQSILSKFGVKGIAVYHYPKNQVELLELGKELDIGPIELVGDFE